MADERIDVPVELRAFVARDLSAVKPLAHPEWRAVGLVPVGIALLFAAVAIFGMRRDASRIGLLLTWGASTLQTLLGLALVVGALREAVPGTTLPRRVVGAACGTVLVAVLAVTFMTWTTSPTTIAPGFVGWVWGVCLTGTIVGALPALAIAGWLAGRAFPLRPRLGRALRHRRRPDGRCRLAPLLPLLPSRSCLRRSHAGNSNHRHAGSTAGRSAGSRKPS